RAAADRRAVELLGLVGIADANRRLEQYPHQLSGGMRQRIMIAIALACDPKLITADEPTTALDVTIQAQILALMQKLTQQLGEAPSALARAGAAGQLSACFRSHELDVTAGAA